MSKHSFSDVIYPPGGVQEICTDLLELFEYKIGGRDIVINTAVQPNCKPHIGTITTFMCAFALAQRIQTCLKRKVTVQLDFLENAPYTKKETAFGRYGISLCDVYDEKQIPKSTSFEKYYRNILGILGDKAGVDFVTRSYNEFQADRSVRTAIFKVLENKDSLKPIISPAFKKIKARIKCPVCNYMDFDCDNTRIQKKSDDTYMLESVCYEHGEFNEMFTAENGAYIMLDTALRDLVKSMHFLDLYKDNVFTIMMDGGDWGGAWALRVHAEALMALGYSELVTRFFAPLILDWSSAKFSKSVYIKDKTVLDSVFCDYDQFYSHYGDQGISLLWDEVVSWVSSPAKFFRNYSIEYIKMVLEKNP